MTQPLQKRFLPLSKIVTFHYWYHKTNTNWTSALQFSKLTHKSAEEVNMGRDACEILEDLRQNDLAGLEKKIREQLAESRFANYPDAEAVVLNVGKITQLKNGDWRVIVNLNGVKILRYNSTKHRAVRDVAVVLLNEFPEIR